MTTRTAARLSVSSWLTPVREIRWKANPGPQREFLFGELGRVREVMYGGAKGGGKSEAIGPKVHLHIGRYPKHARVLILRENFVDLTELIDRMRPQCEAVGGKWNEQKKTWTFPQGAKIRFGHLERGVNPYWGHEFTLIIIDEITRCIKTERDYLMLMGSLRNSHGIPGQVIVLTNPGGEGHEWVKARFRNVPPLTVQRDPQTGLERVFIPAKLSDNPHLDNDSPEGKVYRATLEQLPEAERKAYLDGDWDAFTGQVFKLVPGVHIVSWRQFNERYNLPEDNRAIPADWLRYRSYDHGFAHPGACYWYAVDYDGRAIVYRELYTIAKDRNGNAVPNEGAKLPPQTVAQTIAEYSEGEKYAASWCGPDLFAEVRQDQAGGVKIASHFEAEGIFFKAWNAAPGSRVAGKQALHQRLYYETDEQGRAKDWPGFVVLEGAAPHLVRTFATLEYSTQNVELWDKTSEDHAADSVTGFCKMNPWKPLKRVETPRERMERLRRQNLGGGSWMAH